jgi:hypothetical protein
MQTYPKYKKRRNATKTRFSTTKFWCNSNQ